jgi:glycosyltransferase involved in cell wall biosynthesis
MDNMTYVQQEVTSELLVSIIVPIYNSENYIATTIESCIAQSYKNIEIILVNDGSTDNTERIIEGYLDDNRIRYFPIKNVGACDARNFGIGKAKGNLYQFLDHDDVLDFDKISSQIPSYMVNGENYLYSGTMGTISGSVTKKEDGFEIYERDFSPEQYYTTVLNQFGRYITTGAWLVPKKIIERNNGWDKRAGLNDDGEYFMRLILSSKGIIYTKEAKFFFRRDVPNSLSKQFNSKEVYEKWLFSYTSYAENFPKTFEPETARRLGGMALSVYYCSSYPNYPDLLNICLTRIRNLGYTSPTPYGGPLFKKISKYFGVIGALRVLNLKKRFLKFIQY